MSIPQAVNIGLAGNEISKQITGTSDVSAGRTAVATGSGAALGLLAGEAVVITSLAVGLAAAPVAIPLAVAGAAVSFLASLFDW